MAQEHHVIVVGGGFGGVACVKGLRHDKARITLIDQRNHHLFQPLLYQVATTILPPSEIAWPLRRLFKYRPEVTTLMATVTGVDRENKQVMLADGSRMNFDTLVLATGTHLFYFGHDDWRPHAPGLKTIEDATRIRRRILAAFEAAERCDDPDQRTALMNFAIIGGGPTGVELAGIITELAQRVLPAEFRHIDTRKARVLLIEAGPRVLSEFPEKLSGYAERALTRMAVEVRTGEPVTGCDANGVIVGDHRIDAKTVIWAAGVTASNAAEWLDVEADRAGRAIVQSDLTVPGYPDIFVIGDTASVKDQRGRPVPEVAPAAKQQGSYVARVIRARLDGRDHRRVFRYRHPGTLATIGPSAAVVDFGWIRLTGAIGWWVWGIAHIFFLISTRSRIAVAYSWFWSYITGQKSARLITGRTKAAEPANEEGAQSK